LAVLPAGCSAKLAEANSRKVVASVSGRKRAPAHRYADLFEHDDWMNVLLRGRSSPHGEDGKQVTRLQFR